jgi:hypothetical protein
LLAWLKANLAQVTDIKSAHGFQKVGLNKNLGPECVSLLQISCCLKQANAETKIEFELVPERLTGKPVLDRNRQIFSQTVQTTIIISRSSAQLAAALFPV